MATGLTGPAEALCRDCGARFHGLSHAPCPACGSRRTVAHPELHALSIAHIDCDAFYASVEKRDNPALATRPVIVGGGRRGVVAACCYVARLSGVRSAMPMFKALQLCRDAVVIRPDMAKYAAASRQVRAMMQALTPLVQPLALDEAYLDLAGTEKLHGGSPAESLARLTRAIEREVGITVSIGLSYNKFLAKIASDLDKPRGFALLGRAEAVAFLREQPVGLIWGVGPVTQRRLAQDGLTRIGDLQDLGERRLKSRYGSLGQHLARLARGEDDRRVEPPGRPKVQSVETTFEADIADPAALEAALKPLCERLSRRLKAAGLAGRTVTLKLKTADFRLRTRHQRLASPTQLAETLYRAARLLLAREADGTAFRLLGVGSADFAEAAAADPPELFDAAANRRAAVERTLDALRERFGADAVRKGRGG